jgi:outer membrane protein OmpA-like peptidoglycan-associated protein
MLHSGKVVLLSLGILLAAGATAGAQVLVDGSQRPEVEVDTSVLDQLGRVPTLPDLFLGRRPAVHPVASSVAPHLAVVHRPHAGRVRHASAALPHRQAANHARPIKAAAQPATATVLAAAPTPAPQVAPPVAAPPTVAAAPPPMEPEQAPPAKIAETATSQAEPPPEPPPAPQATAEAPAKPVEGGSAAPALPPVALPAAVPPIETAKPQAAPSRVQTAANTPARPAPAPPQPTQEARLPPPTTDGVSTIGFEQDDARLPDEARQMLIRLAGRLADDASLQIQLLAYAQGDEDTASKARRLSLSRALAVRSFLIDQGVRSTRIEVRALGNKVSEGAPDRVDIVVQKR